MFHDTQNQYSTNHYGIAQLVEGVAELRSSQEGENGIPFLALVCKERDIELD
jgi:hypothetical protein